MHKQTNKKIRRFKSGTFKPSKETFYTVYQSIDLKIQNKNAIIIKDMRE